MPRGPEPKTPLSEREKLQLKQRGDNLRRRQGLGSAKYAEFFFRHRQAYPFTRKTFPTPLGRVEAGNEAWDGVDPETGRMAEWVKPDDGCAWRNRGVGRRIDDDLDVAHYRLVKRLRSQEPQNDSWASGASAAEADTATATKSQTHTQLPAASSTEPSPAPTEEVAAEAKPPPPPSSVLPDADSSDRSSPCRPIQRDLKLLMDALRRIPTPVRAARAIEGMLSRREVQRALEKYGTGSELGLSSKELAAIAVLQNGVTCKGRW